MLLDLVNQSLEWDQLSQTLLVEKLEGDPDFDPDLLLVAQTQDRPVGLVQGILRQGAKGKVGFVKMILVAPEARRLGLGSSLLKEIERIMFGRGVTEIRLGESAPNYLWPGVDHRYVEGMQFFKRAGYIHFSETQNLSVNLRTGWPRTPPQDRLKSRTLVTRALPHHWEPLRNFLASYWPAWVPETRAGFGNHPISIHLALDGEEILGFAGYDCNNRGTGWFGPMGTHPEARGRGIGGLLLHRCLNDLRTQGLAEAIIPWVGPTSFYQMHAGAEVQRTFARFKKARGD